jgi:hypothetical protein
MNCVLRKFRVGVKGDETVEAFLAHIIEVRRCSSLQTCAVLILFSDSMSINQGRLCKSCRMMYAGSTERIGLQLIDLVQEARAITSVAIERKAAGRRVVVSPLLFWSDETGGNFSKKYDKFESVFVRLAGTVVHGFQHPRFAH